MDAMTEPSGISVAVIGGGPAGLMAAETACRAGAEVALYDHVGSVGRKILIAGKGGLNLTHAEPYERFVSRYGRHAGEVRPWLDAFGPQAVREWARGLGVDTVVGSSGRVFPADFKAAPLLRGWVRRLRDEGVRFHMQHRWHGWTQTGALDLEAGGRHLAVRPAATILALGGASWPRLGSDGRWVPVLRGRGIAVATLEPSNCGFECDFSAHFVERHGGAAVKPVALDAGDGLSRRGEFVVTGYGVEGSLVYAASALLRERIARDGEATVHLDLAPERTAAALEQALRQPRGHRSHSEQLRRRVGIDGVRLGLLRELAADAIGDDPQRTAAAIKRLPLRLRRPRPIEEAISSAGGVCFEALDAGLMLRALPGVFCAGEMVDWEAPTGGYLLTACLASGRAAAQGALRWLAARASGPR
jgi:uncharacterized flavoprotein (TIGR03862 family)